MRFGTVAIVGRTNVGKSTFLNACLGERLAIVSPQPQTTRDEILGVVHRPDCQIAFTDTPGLHRPKNELGRRMNARALDTLRSHDVTLFMTECVAALSRPKLRATEGSTDPIEPDDRRLLQTLQPNVPCILVLNKADLVRDKQQLLPLLSAFNAARDFAAIIPISALQQEDVERVLEQIERVLPEREPAFAEDMLTDRPMNFLAREFIREQILLQTQREVPHATAVSIDSFNEGPRLCRISATIHVEKVGQRTILVGRKGEMIKALGTAARVEIEKWVKKQVHLELFVRVSDRWKDMPRQLSDLGYEAGAGSRSLESALPKESKPRYKARLVGGRKAGDAAAAERRAPAASAAKPSAAKPSPAKPSAAKPSAAKGAIPRTDARGSASKVAKGGAIPRVAGPRGKKPATRPSKSTPFGQRKRPRVASKS
jgi:GTP-binding protein Era